MSAKSIALCRVSTPEQRIEGHSLERQEASVVKASEELESPIVKTWSLDQSSRVGKNLNRRDLKEMLDFCKLNKQVKFLIIDEVDRFMRDIKYFYYFEAVFEQQGVKVWYASQPELNTNDMMGKLQKLFLVFRAEASNDERTCKSLKGLKDRIAKGYWPFPLHQGYIKGSEPGLHIPDPERYNLLREAFEEVLIRRFTVNEALDRLNNNGYKSPNGKPLRIDKFRELLKDPYYAGALRVESWDKELWNDNGLHESLITMEMWEELQLVVNNKMRKFQRKQHNPAFPLSNLFYCDECDEKKIVGYIHRNGKSNWTGEEYRCRGCNKVIKKDDLHSTTDTFFDSIKMLESNTHDFKSALREVWAEEQKEGFNRTKQLKIRLENLNTEKNKLAVGIVMNPELKDDLAQSLEEKKTQIKNVEKEISEAENIESDFLEFVEFSIDYIKDLKANWWDLGHDERLECKHLITKDKIFTNFSEKVYTPEISPILKLICNIKGAETAPKSQVVDCFEKFWNTFFNIILGWEPVLRQINDNDWQESYKITTYQAF